MGTTGSASIRNSAGWAAIATVFPAGTHRHCKGSEERESGMCYDTGYYFRHRNKKRKVMDATNHPVQSEFHLCLKA